MCVKEGKEGRRVGSNQTNHKSPIFERGGAEGEGKNNRIQAHNTSCILLS